MSPQKPGMDLADTYIMFVRQNQDILREKVNEEMYIEKLFDVSNYPCKACWYYYYIRRDKLHFDDIQQAVQMFFPVDHFFFCFLFTIFSCQGWPFFKHFLRETFKC